MENRDYFLQLLQKYRDNRCSHEEVKILLSYFRKESNEQDQLMELVLAHLQEEPAAQDLENKSFDSLLDATYLNITKEIQHKKAVKTTATWQLWKKILSAAAITIIVGVVYLYYINTKKAVNSRTVDAREILPKGNRATVTLADGRTIDLSNTHSGITIGDSSISYRDGTAVSDNNIHGVISMSTPRGGEYQVVLSDSTKVWLNAATTLQYSADLRERGRRNVTLVSGEAYFEVAKDKSRPFVVTTQGQEVIVLGTHFNINSYADQGRIITTLAEGSVKVSSLDRKMPYSQHEVMLKPGQQSLFSKGSLRVQQADLQTALGWRNGLIKFKDSDLKSILQEASRWYDIEVEYTGEPSAELFTGGISRTESLEILLKALRLSGIDFKVVEEKKHRRKLIVNP